MLDVGLYIVHEFSRVLERFAPHQAECALFWASSAAHPWVDLLAMIYVHFPIVGIDLLPMTLSACLLLFLAPTFK